MSEEAVVYEVEDTIEHRIKRLRYLREDIKRLEEEVKALKASKRDLELDVMDHMEEQGVTKLGTDFATVSISETEMPTVDSEHWPEVFAYLFENDYLEVMRRQLNSGAWAELKKMGIDVPHVTTFVNKKLNLRAA